MNSDRSTTALRPPREFDEQSGRVIFDLTSATFWPRGAEQPSVLMSDNELSLQFSQTHFTMRVDTRALRVQWQSTWESRQVRSLKPGEIASVSVLPDGQSAAGRGALYRLELGLAGGESLAPMRRSSERACRWIEFALGRLLTSADRQTAGEPLPPVEGAAPLLLLRRPGGFRARLRGRGSHAVFDIDANADRLCVEVDRLFECRLFEWPAGAICRAYSAPLPGATSAVIEVDLADGLVVRLAPGSSEAVERLAAELSSVFPPRPVPTQSERCRIYLSTLPGDPGAKSPAPAAPTPSPSSKAGRQVIAYATDPVGSLQILKTSGCLTIVQPPKGDVRAWALSLIALAPFYVVAMIMVMAVMKGSGASLVAMLLVVAVFTAGWLMGAAARGFGRAVRITVEDTVLTREVTYRQRRWASRRDIRKVAWVSAAFGRLQLVLHDRDRHGRRVCETLFDGESGATFAKIRNELLPALGLPTPPESPLAAAAPTADSVGSMEAVSSTTHR